MFNDSLTINVHENWLVPVFQLISYYDKLSNQDTIT